MKTLFVLRHAKSSWTNETLRDFDRPLNKRGIHDAPRIGEWLAQQSVQPNCIVASPAVRTVATAQAIAKALNLDPTAITTDPRIYEARWSQLVDVIQGFDQLMDEAGQPLEQSDRIMLVGHNPGITNLLNQMDNVVIDNVPTCGLAIIQSEVTTWTAFAIDQANLTSFQYPKQLPS